MTPLDTLTILSFIPAGFALNLTPGADMMFCLAQGLRGGMAQVMLAGLGALAVARPLVIFRQAFMGNILNPKVILAFLPQFVDPPRPMLPQCLPLGLVSSLGGRVVNGVVAGIFAGLAIRLALMQRG